MGRGAALHCEGGTEPSPKFPEAHRLQGSLINDIVQEQKKKLRMALAGVAQWTECWPAKHKGHWFDSQ